MGSAVEGLASLLTLLASVTLIGAARWKLGRPAQFVGIVRAHAIVPAPYVVTVARVLPVVELTAAACGLAVLGPDQQPLLLVIRLGAVPMLALSAAFLGYLNVLAVRYGLGQVPCGCMNGQGAAGALAVARAGLLALAGIAALAVDPLAGTGPARSVVLVVLAGLLSLTAATWAALRPRTPRREPR